MTRILVADDSETVLLMLRRRLEDAGYEVVTARDGGEVLELLRADGDGDGDEAGVDMVLLDAMMPRVSGTEALRRMRADGIETPVLIISAHLYEEEPQEMLDLGANGCVSKPFEWAELITRIEALTASPSS